MPVRVQYVSLEKEGIGITLFAPVIIANLLQSLAHSAADAEVPAVSSQRNVLQRIPGVLSEQWVLQKAPVFVFAQKSVGANRFRGTRALFRLRINGPNRNGQSKSAHGRGSQRLTSPRLWSGSRRCIRPETEPSPIFARRMRTDRPRSKLPQLWLSQACR